MNLSLSNTILAYMKPLNGRTLVKVEQRVNDKINVGGRELILDSMFREFWNTVQLAEVVATGRKDLQPGDIVYVHHFVNDKGQMLPLKGNMSYLEYNQIYARIRDNEMKVLSNFVLVEPVTYGSAGLVVEDGGLLMTTHSASDKVEKMGVAKFLSDHAEEEGLLEGDKILFGKDCEYEILIGDQVLYRMETRDVITTIDSFSDLKI